MHIFKRKKFLSKVFVEALNFNLADTANVQVWSSGFPLGNPRAITEEQFNASVMKLGIFSVGTSDQNKFFSEATAAAVMPRPEDFVDFPFRFISQTIVGGGSWKATDFRQAGVLEASTPLLANKTMYKNHEQEVDNWVGLVADPYWEPAFTSDGYEVPPGIAGFARVDVKTNPKVARGIATGAIKSNSVTPFMKWESSHEFENVEQFYEKVGTMGEDGQMVRRISLEIMDYLESSFVWMGADPFAKRKKADGSLDDIDKTHVFFSKAPADEVTMLNSEKKIIVSGGIDSKIISLSRSHYADTHKTTQPPLKTDDKMNNFLLAFVTAFGTKLNLSFTVPTTGTFTPNPQQEQELMLAIAKMNVPDAEQVTNLALAANVRQLALAAVKTTDPAATTVDMTSFLAVNVFTPKANLDALAATNTLVGEVSTELGVTADKLKDTVVELKANATIGKDFLTLKRDECLRLYKLAVKEEDAAVVSLITKASSTELDGLLKQYGTTNAMKYSATCSKCNSSDNIVMRSSVASKKDEKVTETATFGDSDFREKYGSRNMYPHVPAGEAKK